MQGVAAQPVSMATQLRTDVFRRRREPRRWARHLTCMNLMAATREAEPAAEQIRSLPDVESALDGDLQAFDRLVLVHLPRTYRIALAILGSEADAGDAVQEAWLAAWRQLPTLRDPARFGGWLDQILVNACRMSIRRRGRVREIRMPEGFDAEAPQAALNQVAERDALDRAFGRLTVEQRTILVLHHLERRPLSAIAAALVIPVGTAKSRLHAARAALERVLETER
jgi:RNA polymerase sigma-70 factor (ECF subfamily)